MYLACDALADGAEDVPGRGPLGLVWAALGVVRHVHPGACLMELSQGDGVQQAPGWLGGRVPVAGLLRRGGPRFWAKAVRRGVVVSRGSPVAASHALAMPAQTFRASGQSFTSCVTVSSWCSPAPSGGTWRRGPSLPCTSVCLASARGVLWPTGGGALHRESPAWQMPSASLHRCPLFCARRARRSRVAVSLRLLRLLCTYLR